MDGFPTITAAKDHLAALEIERLGYEARVRGLKAGRPDKGGLEVKGLEGRIKEVDEQIAVMSDKLGKPKAAPKEKGGRPKAEKPEETAASDTGDVVDVEIPEVE